MAIYVTAIIQAKEEYLEQIETQLQLLVTESRKDKGCIQYDLHQSLEDPTIFSFYEIWESSEDLDTHTKQPHFIEFTKTSPQQSKEPTILVSKKI